MNYYEHHLGDYDGHTSHLSWLEDCAYRRLISLYYRSEAPLPADIKQVCRLVRAASKPERDAVHQILSEFFALEADGWHNERCDKEIRRYQDKSQKARESVSKRWANRDPNAIPTNNVGNTNVSTNVSKPYVGGNTLQTPDSRHQTPEQEPPARNSDTAPQAETPPRAALLDGKKPLPEGEMATALRDRGVSVTSQMPTLIAWLKDGFTTQQAIDATEIARLRKPWPEKIPAAYLDAILRQPQRPKRSDTTSDLPPELRHANG